MRKEQEKRQNQKVKSGDRTFCERTESEKLENK